MSVLHLRRLRLLGVFVFSLLVRLLWVADWAAYDDERRLLRIFDGHERHLLTSFLDGTLSDPGPQHHPVVGMFSVALGSLGDDPRILLCAAAVAGALTAVAVSVAVGRAGGASAGLWAGLFVGLLPDHAAWSTSVYPVVFGVACLAGAFAAKRPAPAAALAALSTLLRPELALAAPFLGLPGLGALPGLLLYAFWLGGPPGDLSASSVVWLQNLQLLEFLGPGVLALGVLGLGAPRAGWLLLLAAVVFVGGAAFDDLGPRHVLAGGLALCALAGLAVQRHGLLLGVVLAVGLGAGVQDRSARWATSEDLAAAVRGLPAPDPSCRVVSDEPLLAGQPDPSHWTLWSAPVEGCVLWGEEAVHRTWSSRALWPRARRMRALYDPLPVAAERVPGGWRLYHRLQRVPGAPRRAHD